MYKLAAVLFRRDLRLNDQAALLLASAESSEIIPVFCLNPEQLNNNPYRGDAAVQFMQDCLLDLDLQLQAKASKLQILNINPINLVEVLKKSNVDALYANRDYTPYAIERDRIIAEQCKINNITFKLCDDYLLHPPETVLKTDGKPYTVYTPFYKRNSQLNVSPPKALKNNNFSKVQLINSVNLDHLQLVQKYNNAYLKGGRSIALKTLANFKKLSKNYAEERDYPALDSTTKLSPHLKFGTVSVREVYHLIKSSFGSEHQIIKELYWRDFFTQIAFYFPKIFKNAFNKKYEKLVWDQDVAKFKLWCDGQTGFPIVDAGMRELNQTGYMHNRVRMIVASFLIKDLHINWQWGEKYFAQHLCDYDPAVNNGNWQWAASTGCDAAPYFRIFNPWLQQKKFDPECQYIKRWISELKHLTSKQIHNLQISFPDSLSYPKPIIDHANEKMETLIRYSDL